MTKTEQWSPPSARHRALHARGTTLAEYSAQWLPRHRRSDGHPLKDRTVAHYRKLLDGKILPTLGEVPMRSITPEMVEAWHASLPPAPTYNAHAYALLHLLFKTATEQKVVSTNPCTVKGAARTRPAHKTEPATIAELATIVENMAPRYQLAILLMAWCALRFGEVTELRRSDVDLKRQRIHVQRGVVLVDGVRRVTSPKSAAGLRRVAIPPHLLPVIRDHLAEHVADAPDALLFTARDGGHLSQSTLNGKPARRRVIKGRIVNEGATGFHKAKAAAGRPDLTLHDLRHSGAVLAALTGATLKELMDRLGHSTPSAALRYQHSARDRDAEIARLLSRMVEHSDG
ncbi:tyrosine-type recombinase/integrase [Enemella evansiae]|uniref:tyrosine-type recombinase/integrase n=1 Tax=Enemella evansiae TaxID=2016499 RepID=UPI001E4B0637|nr:site-specific integrase [Enemella evansiae]